MKLTKALILACANKAALDALWAETNTGCTDCTNCKRCTRCTNCEECQGSTDCTDCYNVDNSDNCTSCRHVGNSHNCVNCQWYRDADKVRKLYQCSNCLNCNRCIYCNGLTDAKNMVMGIQLTLLNSTRFGQQLGSMAHRSQPET